MKPNQRQSWIALLALLVSPFAFAGITDGSSLYMSLTDTFTPGTGTGSAVVLSQVYLAGSEHNYTGNYIYTYLISDAQVNLSFFSVDILADVEILAYGWEMDGKAPLSWVPVNEPVESIEAFFMNPLKPGDISATLWFISPQGPTEADGALAGITGTQYNFLVGKILTPIVPEPTTMLLLAAGGLMTRFSRKRKS
jgi:hypothetical protein